MQELQHDFQLFLIEKYFAAFTFSIPPPPSRFVSKNKMSLVHPHTMSLLMEGM
jgi:hypothetical protein